MKNLNIYLTGKCHLSNYQAAQVVFLLKTILSELSKLLIMAILFRRQIIYYLFGLLVMIFLRCTMGGLHFYRYSQCLLASIIYIWLSVIVMPQICGNYIDDIFYFNMLLYWSSSIQIQTSIQQTIFNKNAAFHIKIYIFVYFNIIYNSKVKIFICRILDYYITFASISYCENTFERRKKCQIIYFVLQQAYHGY